MVNKMKEKLSMGKVAVTYAIITGISAVSAVPAFAASTDIDAAMSEAYTSMGDSIMGNIVVALPIALGVVGSVVAIRFGVKFFKGLAK